VCDRRPQRNDQCRGGDHPLDGCSLHRIPGTQLLRSARSGMANDGRSPKSACPIDAPLPQRSSLRTPPRRGRRALLRAPDHRCRDAAGARAGRPDHVPSPSWAAWEHDAVRWNEALPSTFAGTSIRIASGSPEYRQMRGAGFGRPTAGAPPNAPTRTWTGHWNTVACLRHLTGGDRRTDWAPAVAGHRSTVIDPEIL
jgi:hypothetical protein